ncbi:hypothetical protein M9H77_26470 [Catharanthus roseus]|uniref:Uncharacterized protein n=1 Tax=Catharanthus roseus TaxID=4058 RepID=A0ACC0ACG9_CATRO|nr:hypothetical protein M9H77_26470 [Catharanthus roseus]
MVRLSGRRGDDDLGPVTDRTGRVQGRTITASSKGVRGRHSTSDLSCTKSSTQPPSVPFRSRPPHPLHLSHTHVLYEAYGSAYPHSKPPPTVYNSYLAVPTIRPHIPYRSSAQESLTEFSGPARQLGSHERVDDEDDGDGDNDDHDDSGDTEDEEYGSDGQLCYGKGKGLTGSFMSVMSKISGCTSSYTEEESEGFRLGADRPSRRRSC